MIIDELLECDEHIHFMTFPASCNTLDPCFGLLYRMGFLVNWHVSNTKITITARGNTPIKSDFGIIN